MSMHAIDASRPLDGQRPLESLGIGYMYRGNELSAALARSALEELPARTARCQQHAEQLSHALSSLPGMYPPTIPDGSTSVHHKFRVRLDPERAGVDLSPRAFRDLMLRALRAEGLEVVLWQTTALPAHELFQQRRGFGAGFPWSTDGDSNFAELYAPQRFARTHARSMARLSCSHSRVL